MKRHSVYQSLLTAFQRELIRRALAATGGNRTHAARLLGLQRNAGFRIMPGSWPDAGNRAGSQHRASA